LTRRDIENRFDRIAAFADIGQFIDQPVKTYSSGMVVRLAFAVVANVDAEVLVVDEASRWATPSSHKSACGTFADFRKAARFSS
jgi:ABC-type polysaccharide/polyol phosphate transport system ATPase subunit